MGTSKDADGQGADNLFQTGLRLHQEGQLARAEHLYRETLRVRPQHADALNMLGVIAAQTRNFTAGVELLRRAVALVPGHADYHNNLGQALMELGQRPAARASFEAAVAARPRFPEAHFNLANVHLADGDTVAAEQHLRKALRARADYPDALNNLGNLLRRSGRAADSIPLFRKLVALLPRFAPGYYNLALALQAQAQYDDAVHAFERALELDPMAVPVWEALGTCHRQRGALAEAEAAFRGALERAPERAELWNALGIVEYAQNRAADALASFTRASVLDRGQAVSLTHIGMAQAALGQRELAREHFDQALAADSGCSEAFRHLAELETGEAEARALAARIETVLAGGEVGPDQRTELQFTLGKLYDQLRDHGKAFQAWTAANAARHAKARFDAAAQSRYIDALIAQFDRAYFARNEAFGNTSELPVFIIGMPRSGTTLVEQILASHPDVFGAGELTFFPEAVARLPARLQSRKPYPACLVGDGPERVAGLAQEYLALLGRLGQGARRVTDKMPYNFLYLGLIATLFPRARIVHCRRDPMATCFSLYTHDLAGSHPYSYDLQALGAAYRGYLRLMQHWRAVLGDRVLDLDYERLVEAPEPQIRRLLGHLELPWDARCLAFHRTARTVVTASQWQVRQPMYGHARDHWQVYAGQLEPLARALAPAAPGLRR